MLGLYLSLVESEEEKQLIEELYNNNKQVMYNIAFRNLHNSSDAEDAVHEAFLRAINQIRKISEIPSDKQKAYLNVIVRNVSFDMFNKKRLFVNSWGKKLKWNYASSCRQVAACCVFSF